ncbi:hypothetical protein [Pontibacter pamirensis]|uniref:hypothetical protein n=1 Tax=Pontibacter pamirensis TaxID=2562824 RepID=UPI00138A4F77|nr:hypothetical protein [Pontibacter pamirensis]
MRFLALAVLLLPVLFLFGAAFFLDVVAFFLGAAFRLEAVAFFLAAGFLFRRAVFFFSVKALKPNTAAAPMPTDTGSIICIKI